MSEIIDIKYKTVNTENFEEVVDTSFKTFVDRTPTIQELTVSEFFAQYERLFNQIPVNGVNNSHEYIFNRSGKFFEYEKDTQDIQPLLDEIALLRRQLLGNIALQTIQQTTLEDETQTIEQALSIIQNTPSTQTPGVDSGTGTTGGSGAGTDQGDLLEIESGGTSNDGNIGRIDF